MAAAPKQHLIHMSSTPVDFDQVTQECQRLILICKDAQTRSPPWIQARFQLAAAMEQREWILEQRRVATAKQEFEKAKPASSCAFCQQPLPPSAVASSWKTCCGIQLCTTCAPPQQPFTKSACCPICQFPKVDDATIATVAVQAEEGMPWAQCRMAMYLASQSDHEVSARYMEQAAKQNHVVALYSLGCAQATGVNIFVDENTGGAYETLLKAAQLGYPHAQYRVGVLCLDEEETERYNEEEGIKWLTLAAAQNQIDAQTILASLFMNAKGAKGRDRDATSLLHKPNLERAKYWAAVGANQDYGPSQLLLAQAIVMLGRQAFMGNLYLTGYSPIPTIAYWLRCAHQRGNEQASQMLGQIMLKAQMACAACGKSATTELSRCGNCRCAYYCDRQCSARHWMTGHKRDCVKLPPSLTDTAAAGAHRNNNNDGNGENDGVVNESNVDDGRTLSTVSTSFSSLGAGTADTSWLDLLN
jgi:MYND finger